MPLLSGTGGESPRYSPGERWGGREEEGGDNAQRRGYREGEVGGRQRGLGGMGQGRRPEAGEAERERTLQNDLQRMREEWIQWQR